MARLTAFKRNPYRRLSYLAEVYHLADYGGAVAYAVVAAFYLGLAGNNQDQLPLRKILIIAELQPSQHLLIAQVTRMGFVPFAASTAAEAVKVAIAESPI